MPAAATCAATPHLWRSYEDLPSSDAGLSVARHVGGARLSRPSPDRSRRPVRPHPRAARHPRRRARRLGAVHRPRQDDPADAAGPGRHPHRHRVPLPAGDARAGARRQHRGRKTDVYGPRRGGRGARQGQGAGRAGRRPPSGARGRLHARDGAGLRSRAHRQAALYLRQRQGLLWRLRPDEHWRPLAQLRHQVRRPLPQPDRHGPHRRPPHHPGRT